MFIIYILKLVKLYQTYPARLYAGRRISPPWSISISSPADIINNLMPVIYGIIGVAVFGYFVYGGYLWLTSTGDPEKIKKATGTMFHAAVGAGIVVLAYFATRVVGGILGASLF
jgi:hypothetical protein